MGIQVDSNPYADSPKAARMGDWGMRAAEDTVRSERIFPIGRHPCNKKGIILFQNRAVLHAVFLQDVQ